MQRRSVVVNGAWSSTSISTTVVMAASSVAVVLNWRGKDLPAQIYRMDLVRDHGFVIWNNQWFAGHPTLDYSVLVPPLGAVVGPIPLAVISGIIAALLFDRIVTTAFGTCARVGSAWFALATVTNLIVGRVTFAVGVAVGLASVLAMQRQRFGVAAVAAATAALASPLVGLFLATGAVGLGVSRRRDHRGAALVAGAAVAPLLVVAVVFPHAGSFPYEPWALGRDLAVCALVFVVARDRPPAIRWGCAAYAATLIGAFVVPSPVGGNVSRLAQYVAGPLLACLLLPGRRWLLAVVAGPLIVWQWLPAVDGIAFAQDDPSTQTEYYAPLLDYLSTQPSSFGRVEVPSTMRHWEAAYVAPTVPLARGWETQTDIVNNPLFYDGSLTADGYEAWLADNAVEFVALPDTALDRSSLIERQILRSSPSYLQLVWSDAHWKVWRFAGYDGLVDGAARLVALTPSSFTLDVQRAGDLVVRIHSSSHWAVDGPGCATSTPDGWTLIRATAPGTLRVDQELRGTRCPDPDG